MTPTVQKALVALETGAMALGGAFVMALEQKLTTDGFPSTLPDWGHVIAGSLAVAAFTLFARYRNVPGTLAIPVDTGKPVGS
jgi:hypothetical protein